MADVFVTGGSGFVGRNLISALLARGDRVRALARSDTAAKAVVALGAIPVRGELADAGTYADEIRGCSTVYHLAAKAEDWGDEREFELANVIGTESVIEAALRAGVPTLVHVSTEAVLVGEDLRRIDEQMPIPTRGLGPYPRTKALAEKRVLAANSEKLRTVVVRPRFVWGSGDTSVLPKMVDAARRGRFAWIGGGRHLTSTCHVRNCVEALLLAADKGRGGEVYFATDGEPVEFRAFVTDVLATQGVDGGTRSVPFWLARSLASLTGWIWSVVGLRSAPPLTLTAAYLFGREVTVSDAKIRRELGYAGRVSHVEGLAEMRAR